MTSPPQAIARAAVGLRAEPLQWEAVAGGYTNTERWLLRLRGGATAFVKAAVDEQTAGWLQAEHRVYTTIDRGYLPRLLGWDGGIRPVLVLEDLSAAHWPPPWPDGAVDAVLETLAEVASTPPPSGLPRLEAVWDEPRGWADVRDEPAPFLSLGLCSEQWLDAALPTLTAAESAAPLAGDALVHCDVRSDNVCLRAGRALLVDWNHAVIGNQAADVAFWLPSLAAEGGARPEEVVPGLPDAPELAGLIAGFFAVRAALPPPRTAPTVRALQLAQLRVALPWAARESVCRRRRSATGRCDAPCAERRYGPRGVSRVSHVTRGLRQPAGGGRRRVVLAAVSAGTALWLAAQLFVMATSRSTTWPFSALTMFSAPRSHATSVSLEGLSRSGARHTLEHEDFGLEAGNPLHIFLMRRVVRVSRQGAVPRVGARDDARRLARLYNERHTTDPLTRLHVAVRLTPIPRDPDAAGREVRILSVRP